MQQRYSWLGLVNGYPGHHRPIMIDAFPPKQSQKSLHPRLVSILPGVSEAGNETGIIIQLENFPNSARCHWLLRVHVTSNNETVSRQNLLAGNTAKSTTSEGNSALLPANVDQRPPLQRRLMNFQLQNFQLYNKSLLKRLVLRETVNFASLESLRFSGNKINCFPRDQ